MNNDLNDLIKKLKEKQIQETEGKKKRLEIEFKENMLTLIGILMSLSIEYNNSCSKYIKLKTINNVKKELVKYKKSLIVFQNDFIEKELKNTFNESYNELYLIFAALYNSNISKSEITDEYIKKIIQSEFYNKTLDKRISDNTSLIFNKTNKEIINNLTLNNIDIDDNNLINILHNNFDSLTKIEDRLLDTEETRLFNEAQKKVFKEFGVENLLWRSVLEKNTCSICASNDNQPFSIEDINMIPLHANCNCYWEVI